MPDLTAQVDFIEDDVLRLIFLSCHPQLTAGVPGRADAAPGRRPDHRRDRPRLPGRRDRDGPADLPGQEDARRGPRRLRAPRRRRAHRPARRRDGRGLPDLQRGLHRHRGRRLDAPRADQRGDPAGPDARRADAGRAGGARAPGAAGAAGLPRRCPHRRRGPAGPARRPGPQPLGRAPDPPRAGRPGARASCSPLAGRPVGRYYLQAAIASRHARAATPEETDWRTIARLYDVLAEAAPGPVVEVNRAVAHGRAFGPDAGLAVLDDLPEAALAGSHLLPSVRGDLLARAGRHADAAASFREAAALTSNESERSLLLGRAEESETSARI